MSVEMWTWLIVGLTFLGYIYIGYANRVRSTKEFYVAGGNVPPLANGAATAADWMVRRLVYFDGRADIVSGL